VYFFPIDPSLVIYADDFLSFIPCLGVLPNFALLPSYELIYYSFIDMAATC
jgi:hypothetical protein